MLAALLFYCTPLVVPPIYFIVTRKKARRYSKEMLIGFTLQLVWSMAVLYTVRYFRVHGNRDWLYAWFYMFPVNFLGISYFASMPLWAPLVRRIARKIQDASKSKLA